MTRAKPSFVPAPRIWNAFQVAARLGMSESGFHTKRADLERLGLPARDAGLRGWDSVAVERWLDERAGLVDHAPGRAIDRALDEWQPSA